jgi:hypothetical protein
MGAAREKDQADFDLERFMDMFDEAMTSRDPRVMDALRSLMMIVTLTRSEAAMNHGRSSGPLRRLFEDLHHLNSRMHRMEESQIKLDREIAQLYPKERSWPNEFPTYHDEDKYTLATASKMAQQIDQDLTNTLKIKAKGLYHK